MVLCGSIHVKQESGNLNLSPGCNLNLRPSAILAPPLVQVAKAGHVAFLQLLLAHGCSANQQTEDGVAALHLAVQHKSPQTTAALVGALCEWSASHG